MKSFITKLLLILCIGSSAFAFSPAWQKSAEPLSGQLLSISLHPRDATKLLGASHHHIFEKKSTGTWEAFPFTLSGDQIHKVLSFPEISDAFFALTDHKLYRFSLTQNSSEVIFQAPQSHQLLAFAVLPHDPEHYFLGTDQGLFESDDSGKTWFPFEYFKNEPISILRVWNDRLFLAAGSSLYLSLDLTHFQKVFSLPPHHQESADELAAASNETDPIDRAEEPAIHELVWSEDRLWLATEQGIYTSNQDGMVWLNFSSVGLPHEAIKFLIYSTASRLLFAGTDHHFFKLHKNRWIELYQGTRGETFRGAILHPSSPEKILALTTATLLEIPVFPGVEAWPAAGPQDAARDLFRELLSLEPTIQTLQQRALAANDLSQQKIKRWHTSSRISALLPTFSFDKDFSIGNSVDIDRGATNTPDEYIIGPDDIDEGWGWSLSWDVGDLLWSSAQTSIDSRSKLNAETRRDFFAELARLYHERRRLQLEILYHPSDNEWEHQQALLRIDELTALLDGMTDGALSEALRVIYSRRPELETLWQFPHSGD